jgi:hypothetical protein
MYKYPAISNSGAISDFTIQYLTDVEKLPKEEIDEILAENEKKKIDHKQKQKILKEKKKEENRQIWKRHSEKYTAFDLLEDLDEYERLGYNAIQNASVIMKNIHPKCDKKVVNISSVKDRIKVIHCTMDEVNS